MNKKMIASLVLITLIILGISIYTKTTPPENIKAEISVQNDTSITYKNTDYGFDFSLPMDWQGYSVVKTTWTGYPLNKTGDQSGPKLLIRNPKWTTDAHYEDLPILVFTITQWDAYTAEDFSVSAAPIPASELSRNNKYVFALPPRWDFDYSLGYEQAQEIIANKPLRPFNI